MLIRVPTTKLKEIGPPDECAWMEQGVAEARIRMRASMDCDYCGEIITTRFILTLKKGHPNRFFHEDCLSEEDKVAAKWPRGRE